MERHRHDQPSGVGSNSEHLLADVGDAPPPSDFESVSTYLGPPPAQVPSEPEAEQGPTPSATAPEPTHLALNVQLTIEGVEATQGTQFYKSSLHVPHAEYDNAVQLIKNKNLGIRVYPDVRIQLPPGYLSITPRVYGVVWFKRLNTTDTWRKAIPLNGPYIWGRPADEIDRGEADQSLNFRITNYWTNGALLVYARVYTYVGRWYVSPWRKYLFSKWATVPAVRLRAHSVHYRRTLSDGSVVDTGPATPQEGFLDFITTVIYLRRTYPASTFRFLTWDLIEFGEDLTDTSGGGCGAGWNALWDDLRALYFATPDAMHYALMRRQIPTAYGGCGGGNVGASFAGEGGVMAQELGHALTRGHTFADPNWPHYTHPRSASIGEYGFDYATGEVYDPSDSNDFMSYSPNFWVSPYTYRGLIGDINNQPVPAPSNVIGVEDPRENREQLYLNLRVDCEGKVELLSGFRMQGPSHRSFGRETPHAVEVQDAKGRILARKILTLEEAHQDVTHSHTSFFEAIPMYNTAARLVFTCSHQSHPTHIERTVFEIPSTSPTVEVEPLKVKKEVPNAGTLELKWKAKCGPGDKMKCMVCYSNDGGKTWRPVAMGLETSSYTVNLEYLPGGENCRLQVMASTILQTATAQTGSFVVAKKPRVAVIGPIADVTGRRPSRHMELAGAAYSPDGCAEEEELYWSSSIQGHLGVGSHLIANNLVPGEHVISLVALDGMGGETRTEYRVHVLPPIGSARERRLEYQAMQERDGAEAIGGPEWALADRPPGNGQEHVAAARALYQFHRFERAAQHRVGV